MYVVARRAAVQRCNMDRNPWIDLASQTTVTAPVAGMHRKVIVFQFIAGIICEWQL